LLAGGCNRVAVGLRLAKKVPVVIPYRCTAVPWLTCRSVQHRSAPLQASCGSHRLRWHRPGDHEHRPGRRFFREAAEGEGPMRIDWWFVFMFLPCCIMWCLAGFALCWGTHRQRGIEVDRPVTDNLPLLPSPIVVPDHVPDEWLIDESLMDR
jgi:hypothetical protein